MPSGQPPPMPMKQLHTQEGPVFRVSDFSYPSRPPPGHALQAPAAGLQRPLHPYRPTQVAPVQTGQGQGYSMPYQNLLSGAHHVLWLYKPF